LHPTPVAPSNHTPEAHADSRTSRIQEALARRGFYRGPTDGVASPRTKAAIRAFQTSLGDSPSGGLTRIEVVKLLNAW
jgi:peptidoglycan hydrolase-like protein with peptidoglycan-binding domain